jgi:hypothetical protein
MVIGFWTAPPASRMDRSGLVEKRGRMNYESPAVYAVGPASELIQNNFGGSIDGGPIGYNHESVLINIEEE